MAKIDLSTLSLEELTELIDEASGLRANKIEERRKELQRELADLDAIGNTLQRNVGSVRTPAKPKYQSKKDLSKTWAGRGATPRWLVAEMEETGKPMDYFRVGSG